MTADLQTVLALIIVVIVASRFTYKWLKKRKKGASSGSCGCDKDD